MPTQVWFEQAKRGNEEEEQEGKGRCRGMGGVGTYLAREVSL